MVVRANNWVGVALHSSRSLDHENLSVKINFVSAEFSQTAKYLILEIFRLFGITYMGVSGAIPTKSRLTFFFLTCTKNFVL